MTGIEISRNSNGQFVVERVYAGVVIDRYTTCNLALVRRSGGWTAKVAALFAD